MRRVTLITAFMRIFVSSTFRDLLPERQRAIKVLEQMDVPTRKMETFVSDPACPLEVALRELEHSDAVVLIIGFKAGSTIPNKPGLTYTRSEFDHACELAKPVFAFIKTEGGSLANKESDLGLRDALDQFVRAIGDRCTPAYFANSEELGEAIALAIGNWEAKGRPGTRLTFASWEEYFPRRAGLFDYEQTLWGREVEIASLNSFLGESEAAIAVLLGRGGIGKTKLLRDWSRSLAGWSCIFLREGASWHIDSPKEIPAGRVLIVADDAHRFAELPKLVVLAKDLFTVGRCKLLLVGRPSGRSEIDACLARTSGTIRIVRLPQLESLKFRDAESLAAEVLGPRCSSFARQLATLSADTPLVTVIGGRLIARDQVSPLLLNNEEDFRRTVFDRFLAEYKKLLPSGPVAWEDLIQLIAAVSPVWIMDLQFTELASPFLGLRRDQILCATSLLEQHGLLQRRGHLVRIVPDVLSDYILEQACFTPAGGATGFADAVFERFGASFLTSCLRNFSELDWRITQKGVSSALLNQFWNRFSNKYRLADAWGRSQMLTALEEAAFFQPARAMDIVRFSLQDEAHAAGEADIFQSRQSDVIAKLPPIIRNAAYNSDQTEEAVRLLWDLARQDGRATNPNPDHALRLLQEMAEYTTYKSVGFIDRIADIMANIVEQPGAFDFRHTPLDVIDKFLNKEGEHSESEGWTLHLGSFALAYDRVQGIRRKALQVVENCLFSDNARAASRAVESLSRVLSGFVPGFGRRSSDEELRWQDEERLAALAIIERKLDARPCPVALVWGIRVILRHFRRRHRREDAIDIAMDRLLARIADSDDLAVYDALCTSEWESQMESRTLDEVQRSYSTKVERAAVLLRSGFPRPENRIVALERIFSEAFRYGVNPSGSCFAVMKALIQGDPNFRKSFSTYVLGSPAFGLGFQIRALLTVLRDEDPAEYVRVGSEGAGRSGEVSRGVANSVCYCVPIESPTQEDLCLLTLLSHSGDHRIRSDALHGIAKVGRVPAYRDLAIRLALGLDVEGDAELANDLGMVFHPSCIDPVNLSAEQVRVILDKFVPIDDLERNGQAYHLSAFLDWSCAAPPELAFEFIVARLDYEASLETRGSKGYRSVPYPEVQSSFRGFSRSPHYSALLAQVRDRLIAGPYPQQRLTDLFWSMADLNTGTLGTLDEWLHSESPEKVRAVVWLIHWAPAELAFQYPYFVLHLVDSAAVVSKELAREAISVLASRAGSGGWHGSPGQPPEAMVKRIEIAKEIAKKMDGIPCAREVFAIIVQTLEYEARDWVERSPACDD